MPETGYDDCAEVCPVVLIVTDTQASSGPGMSARAGDHLQQRRWRATSSVNEIVT